MILETNTAHKVTPFPKKMGTHMLPLSVFEGGGGRLLLVSEFKSPPYVWNWVYVSRVLKFHENYPIFLGEIKLGCREES